MDYQRVVLTKIFLIEIEQTKINLIACYSDLNFNQTMMAVEKVEEVVREEMVVEETVEVVEGSKIAEAWELRWWRRLQHLTKAGHLITLHRIFFGINILHYLVEQNEIQFNHMLFLFNF